MLASKVTTLVNFLVQVYRAALELIPHKRFTFAKLWLLYAQFEIRQKEVRLILAIFFYCPQSFSGGGLYLKVKWLL